MKLSLKIKSGTLAGHSFELGEGITTIGRGENCKIKFDPFGEKIASKNHAFIELKPDGFYLTDANSTNGTYLNGQKITTVKLNSGDQIQFGKQGAEAEVEISGALNQSQLPTLTKPISEAEYFGQHSEQTVIKPQIPPVNQANLPTAVYQTSQPQPFAPQPFQQPMNWRNSFSGIGMNAIPMQQPVPKKPNEHLFAGLAIFFVAFLTLFVSVQIILPNLGWKPAAVASTIAFLPAIFYLLPLIWLDRYDPEPLWLLGLAFAWGGLVSVIVSYQVNTAFAQVAISAFGPEAGMAFTGIISAPIFEEASKGLGLVLLLIFFRRQFDDILDGIVFAGTIALGFATVENVLYYGGAYIKGGGEQLFGLFVLRGIFSPFAHVTFTAMTGIGCGISRESHNQTVRYLMPVLGYGCAILLHFIWNFMATVLKIEGLFEGDWWYGYLFLQFPFFIIFICFAFYIMYRQNKILKEMLAIDVARGLIPEEHKNIATSAFRSTGWLIAGIFNGTLSERSRYLRAIGKLGLSYWHIQRATAAQGETGSFQQNPILREEVLKWRDKV